MENWQLPILILAAILVGALIPVLIIGALAIHRAGVAISDIGIQIKRTLTQIEIISDRVEVLSRGLQGGEKNVAELIAAVGSVAQGLERNMKIINITSTIIASVGSVVAAYAQNRFSENPTKAQCPTSEPSVTETASQAQKGEDK